jgi:hypothetical protein
MTKDDFDQLTVQAAYLNGILAEREACAKLCEEMAKWHSDVVTAAYETAADAIRARGAGMKCIVKDCENHVHQGNFVGAICAPCNQFLTTGEGKYSQLYRNTVAAEREACATVCDKETNLNADKHEPVSQYQSGCYITAEFLAAAIRARGQV